MWGKVIKVAGDWAAAVVVTFTLAFAGFIWRHGLSAPPRAAVCVAEASALIKTTEFHVARGSLVRADQYASDAVQFFPNCSAAHEVAAVVAARRVQTARGDAIEVQRRICVREVAEALRLGARTARVAALQDYCAPPTTNVDDEPGGGGGGARSASRASRQSSLDP